MIILNPEFHRNLWLKFSPIRLAAMPLLWGAYLFIFINFDKHWLANILGSSYFLYVGIVIFWGCIEVGSSLQNEIKNNTFDFQKMSSISPWQLSVGKIFGSTSYAWYLGLPLLAIHVFFLEYQNNYQLQNDGTIDSTIILAFGMLMAGILGHAATFLASFYQIKTKSNSRGVSPSFVFGLMVSGTVLSIVQGSIFFNVDDIDWHGSMIGSGIFTILSLR